MCHLLTLSDGFRIFFTVLSVLQVFRSPDNRGFLVRSCIFAYGVPVLIVVLNVASTVGYLDTFNAAVTCDGGISCNCFSELYCNKQHVKLELQVQLHVVHDKWLPVITFFILPDHQVHNVITFIASQVCLKTLQKAAFIVFVNCNVCHCECMSL